MWIKCFYYVFDYVYDFWIVMLMYDGVGEFYILLFVGKIVYVLVVIVKKCYLFCDVIGLIYVRV